MFDIVQRRRKLETVQLSKTRPVGYTIHSYMLADIGLSESRGKSGEIIPDFALTQSYQ